jgi:hypothetical protein
MFENLRFLDGASIGTNQLFPAMHAVCTCSTGKSGSKTLYSSVQGTKSCPSVQGEKNQMHSYYETCIYLQYIQGMRCFDKLFQYFLIIAGLSYVR